MIELDGHGLSLEDVRRISNDTSTRVGLAESAQEAIHRSRACIEELIERGESVYGVTTGFGRLAEVRISGDDRLLLQQNLIRSHAAGMGQPLSESEVRTIMVLRANALSRGQSGCRLEVVEQLIAYLNAGIHPVVPELGSVGASGDLAPLAHIALALIGEGEVFWNGKRCPTSEALAANQLSPIVLREKEGLALINGTQVTTGLGLRALLRAEAAADLADLAGAMTLEGLRGTPEAFRSEVHEARPHPGQIRAAARLRALMEGSGIRESHRHDDPRVQDAYCLRCMPQVHGAGREVMGYIRSVIEREANSTTDNPLVFPEAGVVVSAGNFHAQIVAQALDFLAIAAADLASISERRIERLLNPDLSGLPAFLSPNPGIHSGFMIAQVTVVDILAEMRVLSHPASVDSVPTSANQEDHISMGMACARKVRRSIDCLEMILSVELMCAAQALEFLKPLEPGPVVGAAYAKIREVVDPLGDDRVLSVDMEAMKTLVSQGTLATETVG